MRDGSQRAAPHFRIFTRSLNLRPLRAVHKALFPERGGGLHYAAFEAVFARFVRDVVFHRRRAEPAALRKRGESRSRERAVYAELDGGDLRALREIPRRVKSFVEARGAQALLRAARRARDFRGGQRVTSIDENTGQDGSLSAGKGSAAIFSAICDASGECAA